MKVDKLLISKLEKLARLELSGEEREGLTKDLSSILEMVEKLQELDTEGVDPLVYINEEVNILRSDQMDKQLSQKDALKNAPDQDGTFFRVPKVINLKK
ncbi:MAG: Asp-tRNA(Asn)/Glu-tRNA(Gln) amidotransferase subunit GatC [Saprospiraceae bacterium]|nr:Asp-tRNA(Asn)/Glu-tRNA(Gln) amidotransferase subunit GatC [Saprospiraceae bacterium]